MEFDTEKILWPDTVVHCKTPEQARELFIWADSQGLRRANGDRYDANNTGWDLVGEDACYDLNGGALGDIDFYEYSLYTIWEFNEIATDGKDEQNKV